MADGEELHCTQTGNTKQSLKGLTSRAATDSTAAVHENAFAAPYTFPLGGLGVQIPVIILFCKPLTY